MTSLFAGLGTAIAVAGALLALRSGLLLAGRGRPRRGPRPSLVIAGPYRRMRNPLCLGLMAMLAGATIASGSQLVAFAAVAGAVTVHAWIVTIEEPALTEKLGAAYVAYLRRVPRWLPRFDASTDDA